MCIHIEIYSYVCTSCCEIHSSNDALEIYLRIMCSELRVICFVMVVVRCAVCDVLHDVCCGMYGNGHSIAYNTQHIAHKALHNTLQTAFTNTTHGAQHMAHSTWQKRFTYVYIYIYIYIFIFV